jgi:dolichyldiphosphatase
MRQLCLASVKYAAGDRLSELLARACLAPYLVLMFHLSAAYVTRDIVMLTFAVGALANVGLSRSVKAMLRHSRPQATCHALGKCASFGMPSSHAQTVAFAFGAALVVQARRRGLRKTGVGEMGALLFEIFEIVALGLIAAVVCVARVYLGYHSASQVVAGVVLGLTHSWFWARMVDVLDKNGFFAVFQRLLPFLVLKNSWNTPFVHERLEGFREKMA